GAGASDLRRREVDLAGELLGAVVALADGVGVEGVGGQEVGAGVDVLVADLGHDLGPRQVQEIVVALLVVRELATVAETGLVQPIGLDGGAVRAVLHKYSVLRDLTEQVCLLVACHGLRTPSKWQVANVRSARFSV